MRRIAAILTAVIILLVPAAASAELGIHRAEAAIHRWVRTATVESCHRADPAVVCQVNAPGKGGWQRDTVYFTVEVTLWHGLTHVSSPFSGTEGPEGSHRHY